MKRLLLPVVTTSHSVRNSFIMICFVAAIFQSAHAQNNLPSGNWRFNRYTTENGLPSNSISCLLQDKTGYLWIGTSAGLVRFDGYEMKTYVNNPDDTTSLSHNNIKTLFEDSKGYIWIGTFNNGICRYNPVKDEIKRIALKVPDRTNKNAVELGIHEIIEDKQGFFYINSTSGLIKVNPDLETVSVTIDKDSAGLHDRLKEMGSLGYTMFYHQQFDKVFYGYSFITPENKFRPAMNVDEILELKLFENKDFLKSIYKENGDWMELGFTAIAADNTGNLWAGSQNGGIFCAAFDSSIQKLRLKRYIASSTVKSMFFDKASNRVLAGLYGNGFLSIDPETGKTEQVQNNPFDKNSLPANSSVIALLRDKSGVLWAGTGTEGLYYSSPITNSFFVFQKQTGNKNSISSDKVNAVYEDRNGVVWVATSNNLNSYDLKTEKWTEQIRKDSANYNRLRSLKNIHFIHEKNENEIYLGTWGYGIFLFNKQSGNYSDIPYVAQNKYNLWDEGGTSWVNHLSGESKKGLIVSTWGSGIYLLDTADHKNKLYLTKLYWGERAAKDRIEITDSLYFEGLGTVSLSLDSLLLYGTERGLYVLAYEGEDQKINARYFTYVDSTSISSGYINAIYIDSKKNIWVGTDKGLNLIKAGLPLNNKTPFIKFPQFPEIAETAVTSIVEDLNHEYWIGTNKGICRLNLEKQTCRRYNHVDGLPSLDLQPRAISINHYGRIYAGTNKGMFYFHPDSVYRDENLNTTVLTSFKIFRNEYPLDTSITYKRNIKLSYRENHLAIKFAALNFVNPSKVQYQYKLDGYDEYWTTAGIAREAVYTSLEPGTYTFMVKSTNNEGVWGEPRKLVVEITPPFWQTWWFRILSVLVIVCSVLAYFKNREIKLKQQNALLEQTVKERTAEVVEQKELVEEKNKHITDSIEYAKRIQTAILPPDKLVKEYLKNSFVLYLPKDIVAGDFYWMETIEQQVISNQYSVSGEKGKPNTDYRTPVTILFAACDCTGHGVPGAMVSVMCHNALNRAVREYNLTEPAKILDKVVDLVEDNFNKSEDEIQDGMDASLCAYYPEQKKLQWAGANNPLWIVRNNEIIEYKPDKQPIGKYDYRKPYTNHEIELHEGDTFYIFSDGYHDQFGDDGEKKLTKKGLRKILLGIQDKPMNEQRAELLRLHNRWKGEVEQIDDICVIGVRV